VKKGLVRGLAIAVASLLAQFGVPPEAAAKDLKLISDVAATGFKFPESVACDPQGKALYASQFGSELKPAEKDGKGKISKLSLDGKVQEEQFLPAAGDVLNKPKGIWIKGNRLWVTDIDAVWVFDLKTRKGRRLAIPDLQFANDPAVVGSALYFTDNRADKVYRVEPADYLAMQGEPKVTVVISGKSVNPNGIYPAKDGSLLLVGFKSPEEGRSIYAMSPKGDLKELSKPIGRLDGIYQMADGTLLATDWNSGTLFSWTAKDGMKTLASNFKGPADLCAMPNARGVLVVVPDLVKSEIRLIQLGR
jgi:sugar lactone lactonase YvrE